MEEQDISPLYSLALDTLKGLVAIASTSRNEDAATGFLMSAFQKKDIKVNRVGNNLWAANKSFRKGLPTLLLNSHIDTVPPNKGYTLDPLQPIVRDEKLYGLGANDAGGALVSLLMTFFYFYKEELPFNIIFGASAEEEISGKDGVELLLKSLPPIDFGIVGEPTDMHMAVAQKGLMVIDGIAKGVSGHAARDEGENALYKATEDIQILRNFNFGKVSDLLGPVHLAVTSINTPNKAHNVVPDECTFVIDIRVNECYTFEEILRLIAAKTKSELTPRSMRLKPSFITGDHPLVLAGKACGMNTFGSPTLSDMALMDFPTVKVGPGSSSRSHTADEFIYLSELSDGISKYILLIRHLIRELNFIRS